MVATASLFPGVGRNRSSLLFIHWHLIGRHKSSRSPLGLHWYLLVPHKVSTNITRVVALFLQWSWKPWLSTNPPWSLPKGSGGLAASSYLVWEKFMFYLWFPLTLQELRGRHPYILVRMDHSGPHSVFAGIGGAWATLFSVVFDWKRTLFFS